MGKTTAGLLQLRGLAARYKKLSQQVSASAKNEVLHREVAKLLYRAENLKRNMFFLWYTIGVDPTKTRSYLHSNLAYEALDDAIQVLADEERRAKALLNKAARYLTMTANDLTKGV